MLSLFRKIAFWEGISLILLIGLAMPLKYLFDKPQLVQIIGMIHGVLFVGYVILAAIVKKEKNWNMALFIFCFIASLIPFGTFYLDAKLLKKFDN